MTLHRADVIRGVAALAEMLDCIGGIDPSGESIGDHAVAKILVEYEISLRALVKYSIEQMAGDA